MRKFLTILMLCLTAFRASAQNAVEDNLCIVAGVVQDAGNRPLEFANIVMKDMRGRVRGLAFSDGDGRFAISSQTGEFVLECSYVGYGTFSKQITCAGSRLDMGTLHLEETEELDAASIVGETYLRQESDRLVYLVESDPDTRKLQMMESLQKIPGLTTHSRGRRLVYKDQPISKILIDDEENGLISAGRQYTMRFIQAGYMSKVELVLPDSPEYGNDSPILLISLKRKLPYGVAMELGDDISSEFRESASADAVANLPLTGVGVKYTYSMDSSPELVSESKRELLSDAGDLVSVLESSGAKGSSGRSHKLALNFFRPLFNDKTSLNISMNTSKLDGESYSNTANIKYDALGNLISKEESDYTKNSSSPMRMNVSVSLKKSFEERKNDSFQLLYSYNDTRNSSTGNLVYPGNPLAGYIIEASSGTKIHNASANLTLRDQSGRNRWGIRAKAGYIGRHYDSDTRYSQPGRNALLLDYSQNILYADADYIGYSADRKFSYDLGLLAEDVVNNGISDFNIIPSVSVSGYLNKHRISASYSPRVRRPDLSQMNPYTDVSNPSSIVKGNPDLKGELTHTISSGWSYSFTRKIIESVSLNYSCSLTGNAIAGLYEVGDDNISYYTYDNIGGRKAHSIRANLTFRPLRDMRVTLNGNYNLNAFEYSGIVNRFGYFNGYMSVSGSISGFFIDSNLMLSPSSITTQTKDFRMEPVLSLMIMKGFDKANIDVSLEFDDLLHGRSGRRAASFGSDTFYQSNMVQRLGRTVSLSLRWQFGRFKKIDEVNNSVYDMQ